MCLRITVPVVVLAAMVLLAFVSRDDNESMRVSAEPPYHATLDSVAANAAAAVQGTVVGSAGKFDLGGSPSLYAYDVVDFRVDKILGQTDPRALRVGDVIRVGMFAVSSQPAEISNLAEVRAEIEAYTSPLEAGSALTVFIAPFRFSSGVAGWAIVGGDYGVLQQDGIALRSRAPRGPLASMAFGDTDLFPAVSALGSKPAPAPGSGDPLREPSLQTPATGPR